LSTLTWLHLSDWHQKGDEFGREILLKGLVSDIKKRNMIDKSLEKLDFVFFTGDLAFYGKYAEYIKAKEVFLDPVIEAAELGPKWFDKFYIVPGNHDLDWDSFKFHPEKIMELMADEAQVQEWLRNDRNREVLFIPFRDYSKFIKEFLGKNHTFKNTQPAYTFIKNMTISGKKIAVLGFNSAWLSGREKNRKGDSDDYGHLRVGEVQLLSSLGQCGSSDLKIALLHHPFEWYDFPDRRLVPEHLGKSCHIVLFGHQHYPQLKREDSIDGSFITIPAGSCYERRDKANGYNYVKIDFDAGEGVIYFRKWNDRQDRWDSDTDTYEGGKFTFSIPKVKVTKLQVASAVVTKDDVVLLVRRKLKEGNLWWQFPSSVIIASQTDESVAQRAVLNEAGIKCKPRRKIGYRIHPDTCVIVHYWQCDYVSGRPIVKDKRDLDKVEWVKCKDALKLISSDIYPPIRDMLKRTK
jgi:predicted phosphodiesterase/8-oxo-dGTP pyrophosphatase MutT (NUDIX family)